MSDGKLSNTNQAASQVGATSRATCPDAEAATNKVAPDSQEVVVAAVRPASKSLCDAYILAIPLGILGAHHFYLRRPGFGVLYICTLGLLGVGWIGDLFRMPYLVARANKILQDPEKAKEKSVVDAYTLWFPLGLFGAHHFYLGRIAWGFGYMFTFGFLGLGWIFDACRMHCLVKDTNKGIAANPTTDTKTPKRTCDAVVLGITPLGLLGAHHYYLGNIAFGVLYTFTLGLLGVGWIVDWFRIPVLTKRANERIMHGKTGKKHLDQAYVLAFPLGFLGFHHYYLNRPAWGVLYTFTLGGFAIGWLFDLFRMPCLVSQVNTIESAERDLVNAIREARGQNTCVIVTSRPPAYINPGACAGPQGLPSDASLYPPLPGAEAPPAYSIHPSTPPPVYGLDNPGYCSVQQPDHLPKKE